MVIVNFLERPMLPLLHQLVRPGGHLVFTTFTRDHPREKPPMRFRLERGELGRGLPGLETRLHEEAEGRAGLLAERTMR